MITSFFLPRNIHCPELYQLVPCFFLCKFITYRCGLKYSFQFYVFFHLIQWMFSYGQLSLINILLRFVHVGTCRVEVIFFSLLNSISLHKYTSICVCILVLIEFQVVFSCFVVIIVIVTSIAAALLSQASALNILVHFNHCSCVRIPLQCGTHLPVELLSHKTCTHSLLPAKWLSQFTHTLHYERVHLSLHNWMFSTITFCLSMVVQWHLPLELF